MKTLIERVANKLGKMEKLFKPYDTDYPAR
jgi:hypothetical protein